MKLKVLFLSVSLLLLLASCRSEFEKIRQSGDPKLLYEKATKYYEEEEYQKAQTLYELVISSYRGKKEAEDIYFKYAYTYYYLGRYILASYYFNNFSQTYGASQFREEADFMSAYSNYQLSPTFRLDQSYSEKAIEGFQLFVNTYPRSERVKECNRLIDEMRQKMEVKTLEEGRLYFDLRQYQSAMHSLENLLKDFPDTDNAEEIRYLIIKSNYLLANNSVVDRQQERYLETSTKASEFLERNADSKYAKEISNIYKNVQKKLKNVGYKNQSARARS